MFKSIKHLSYNASSEQQIYSLVDSEFGMIEVTTPDSADAFSIVRRTVIVVNEYSKRWLAKHQGVEREIDGQDLFLYVGKNLASFSIWYVEEYKYELVKVILHRQDTYCPKYIPNWKEYAASRDERLAKILLLR